MNASEFMRRVVPGGGHYCVEWNTGKVSATTGKPFFNNAGFKGTEALQGRLQELQDKDVYFVPAAMRMASESEIKPWQQVPRRAENVVASKALWADIDVRSAHKPDAHYASVKEAWDVVVQWTTTAKLPRPNVLVRSGWGLHVYWILDTALTYPQWRELSRALIHNGVNSGVKADWNTAAQPYQIMRLPGTNNFKVRSNPRPVTAISLGPDIPIATMQEALSTEIARIRSAETPQARTAHDPHKWEGLRYSAELAAEKCQVLKHIAENKGAGTAEPLWTAMMQMLSHCHDGDALVHEWSKGHHKYTPEETEKKWDYVREKFERPPTCQHMAAAGGAAQCATCPFNGATNSPIKLAQDDTDLPKGYVRVPDAVLKIVEYASEPGEADKRIVAIPASVRGLCLTEVDAGAGTNIFELSFEAAVGGSGWSRFATDITELAAGVTTDIGRRLHQAGINIANPRAFALAKETMMDWATHLRSQKKVVKQMNHRQLGWISDSGDRTGFVLGAHAYHRGKPPQTITPAVPANMLSKYTPRGSLAPWQEYVRLITERGGSIDLMILVAASLGAPLVSLSQVRGLVLNAHSPESGSGKTTALAAAQAVWGHPREGAMAVDDTENAVANALGILRHLPVIWDEVRSRGDGGRMAQLIFRVSQGKERSRLTANSTMMAAGTWETLIAVGSNVPLEDVMDQHSGETLAGVNRVFSLRVPRLPPAAEAYSWPDLDHNFGAAGEVLVAWLVNNVDHVRQAMDGVRKVVVQQLGADHNERFWRELIVVVMTATWCAEQAGLTKFDRPAMWKRLMEAVREMRAGREVEGISVGETSLEETDESRAIRLLREFLTENAAGLLRTNTLGTGGGLETPAVLNEHAIRQPLHSQVATADRVLLVSRTAFLTWAVKNRYGRNAVKLGMERLFGKTVTSSIGYRTTFSCSAAHVWSIDLNSDTAKSLVPLLGTATPTA